MACFLNSALNASPTSSQFTSSYSHTSFFYYFFHQNHLFLPPPTPPSTASIRPPTNYHYQPPPRQTQPFSSCPSYIGDNSISPWTTDFLYLSCDYHYPNDRFRSSLTQFFGELSDNKHETLPAKFR